MSFKRLLSEDDIASCRPVHAVWELTLACDLHCKHCGSRAGRRRPEELSLIECLDLVRQLADLGTREITVIGGEAYLRSDWLEIIREIRSAGMDCALQTGARNLTVERIQKAADAGLQGIGVSIDGLESLHDQLRGSVGSFSAALSALANTRSAGLVGSVNTQITAPLIPDIERLFVVIAKSGAKHWQVQLTVAMGNAADNPELLIQPYQLLNLMPRLASLYASGIEEGVLLQPGNNIGYYGPYESLWRGSGDESIYWRGCSAGKTVIGIEADGTIKGCPSLPTVAYSGGNIRTKSLAEIWRESSEIAFARQARTAELWGYCRDCYYAEHCQGGCTWTAHSLFGRPGNNPYCHHRALELEARGLRESVVQIGRATGKSFDHGLFEILLEEIPCASSR